MQASAPGRSPAAVDRAAPQDEDELRETAALAVMYVAGDFLADPPDAPKHVVRDLEAWLCEPALLVLESALECA